MLSINLLYSFQQNGGGGGGGAKNLIGLNKEMDNFGHLPLHHRVRNWISKCANVNVHSNTNENFPLPFHAMKLNGLKTGFS